MKKTYIISNNLVTALVNSDESGLDDAESRQLAEWVIDNKINHTYMPDQAETTFRKCAVKGLDSDWVEVECELGEDVGEDIKKQLALATHLDCSMSEAWYDLKKTNNYSVYTDSEANEVAADYIKETLWAFNANFLETYTDLDADAIKLMQEKMCEGCNSVFLSILNANGYLEQFISDAIGTDGRGHFMSTYDGDENEVTVCGETYYICRNN